MASRIRVARYLQEQRRFQWLKPQYLREVQQKRLRAVVKHAYDNVTLYHRIFDSLKLKPEDIKSVEDLSQLPVLTRKDVTDNFPDGIVAKNFDIKKCGKQKTSGTRGKPLQFIFERESDACRSALHLHPMVESGLKFWHKLVRIEGPTQFPKEDKPSLFKHLGFMLNDSFGFIPKQRYVSIYSPVEDIIPMLKDFNPDIIYGWPTYLFVLAKAVEDIGIRNIHPKLVFTISEVLGKHMRAAINSVFGVEPVDLYGSIEMPMLAWECKEHIGYHMNTPYVVIETLDIKTGEHVSPGERGEVVITNLYNYAMPLIRYELEDVCVLNDEQCTCGRGLPLLKNIEGRTSDLIVLPDGRILTLFSIWDLTMRALGIKYSDWPLRWSMIGEYRVIQEKKDQFIIEIVKGKDFTPENMYKVERAFRETLGKDVEIKSVIVDEIPRGKSGKHKWIVSKVPIP